MSIVFSICEFIIMLNFNRIALLVLVEDGVYLSMSTIFSTFLLIVLRNSVVVGRQLQYKFGTKPIIFNQLEKRP
jgi:hypothetical protein